MLDVALFDYELPDEFIARYPAEKRDGSKMMVVDRLTGSAVPKKFTDIMDYINPGDLLIYNNTKVRRGRFYGHKVNSGFINGPGAKFEVLLLDPAQKKNAWNTLLRPGKRAKVGTKVILIDRDEHEVPEYYFTVTDKHADGTVEITFNTDNMSEMEDRCGHIPLPPYINRPDEPADSERYQTVYAATPGAVAAPTAGLHFTNEILTELRNRGVKTAELTLHVGAGTFKPIETKYAEEHKMHFENFTLTPETAKMVNETRASGHRVIAVGTTTVRVLESCVDDEGMVSPQSGRTGIFLYPPYKPRAVDMLLTNFHLPKSTLLMLVSCFVDRAKMFEAYELAKKEHFRFYSYGDCMLLNLPLEK